MKYEYPYYELAIWGMYWASSILISAKNYKDKELCFEHAKKVAVGNGVKVVVTEHVNYDYRRVVLLKTSQR